MAEKVRGLPEGHGLNAATGEYGDMLAAGIPDPTKVVRSALQNAASIAALFLTTEAVVADKPEKAAPAGAWRAAWAAWTSDPPLQRPDPDVPHQQEGAAPLTRGAAPSSVYASSCGLAAGALRCFTRAPGTERPRWGGR